MAPIPGRSHDDFSEVRARAESIGAGVRLTLATCIAGWLYAIVVFAAVNAVFDWRAREQFAPVLAD